MINKNQYMKKPVFSGHESFACKSHWLKRGYDFVLAGHSFNNEDAVVHLGVGKNMVNSIKYWMRAFGLLKAEGELTSLAHKLMSNENGYDPFFEDTGSLWLLHFNLINEDNWLTHYCFFEFYLLDFLGIGLDLSECAATGTTENLAYVSPKTGRAVCREAGEPYRDRLFLFPEFIVTQNYRPNAFEMADLLKMTEFFLNKNFFAIHNLKFPECRVNLAEIVKKP